MTGVSHSDMYTYPFVHQIPVAHFKWVRKLQYHFKLHVLSSIYMLIILYP